MCNGNAMLINSDTTSMYLKMQNRKKEEAAAESSAMGAASSMDFMDLTDKEHAEFRYVF